MFHPGDRVYLLKPVFDPLDILEFRPVKFLIGDRLSQYKSSGSDPGRTNILGNLEKRVLRVPVVGQYPATSLVP